MAINKESNGYTFFFSTAMVVVVASILAFLAMALKPMQKENQQQEKMQNILATIGVDCERSEAPDLFEQYVTRRIILNKAGETVGESEGVVDTKNEKEGFNVDVRKDFRAWKAGALSEEELEFPLFICEKEGKTFYVLPVVGKGLWGPIWGFIAMEDDLNTVFGAKFDHKTETPGLGAEINTPMFQDPFVGKKVFDESGEFASISVVKAGSRSDDHSVDGITGGTITSNGVDEMLERTLMIYSVYFKANAKS